MTQDKGASFDPSRGPWICFHCGEVCETPESASSHFGDGNYEREEPVCIEAATTELKELVTTAREMWTRLLKVEGELEQAEFERDCWSQAARKAVGDPYASWHDLGRIREDAEGRALAAETALNAAPGWLADWLRRRAEKRWQKVRRSMGRLAAEAREIQQRDSSQGIAQPLSEDHPHD